MNVTLTGLQATVLLVTAIICVTALEMVNMVTLKHNGSILTAIEIGIAGLAAGAVGIKLGQTAK